MDKEKIQKLLTIYRLEQGEGFYDLLDPYSDPKVALEFVQFGHKKGLISDERLKFAEQLITKDDYDTYNLGTILVNEDFLTKEQCEELGEEYIPSYSFADRQNGASVEELEELQKPFAEFAAENIDKFQLLIDELVEIANHYVPGWDSDTNNFTL